MEVYELTYIVEGKAQERLAALAERYHKINGWDKKGVLQFAVAALAKPDIEIKLDFLEKNIEKAEKITPELLLDEKNGTTDKAGGRKWSRDWGRFEWGEVEKRLVKAEKRKGRGNVYDVGISHEEFLEYLDWLRENSLTQYYEIILSLQLEECGLSDKEAAFCLKHPDVLRMVLDKIKG